MKRVLFYYGYPNSFNSNLYGWNKDAVVSGIGTEYDVVVFGNGLANPSHPDYSNTQYIISNLKSNYAGIEVFGYVTADQSLSAFQTDASRWDTLEVNGIFMDEAGFDFNVTRADLNDRIGFCRELNYATKIFVNAWDEDDVIDTVSGVTTDLLSTDYYLLENLTITNSSYETQAQWYERANKAKLKESSHGIKPIAVSVLADNDADGQEKFNNIYYAAHIWGLHGVGSSNTNYGATDSKVKFWTAPSVSHL